MFFTLILMCNLLKVPFRYLPAYQPRKLLYKINVKDRNGNNKKEGR
jgi:hypothetical protein